MKPMQAVSEILELEKLVREAEAHEEDCKEKHKQAKGDTAKAVSELRHYINQVRTKQIPIFLELPTRSDPPDEHAGEPSHYLELDAEDRVR